MFSDSLDWLQDQHRLLNLFDVKLPDVHKLVTKRNDIQTLSSIFCYSCTLAHDWTIVVHDVVQITGDIHLVMSLNDIAVP